jgi:hypothetical protein
LRRVGGDTESREHTSPAVPPDWRHSLTAERLGLIFVQ